MVDAGIIVSAWTLAHQLVIALAIEMGADAIDIGQTSKPRFTKRPPKLALCLQLSGLAMGRASPTRQCC
jgi:hypothetical protein